MSNSKGFSILEIMISVSLIGVLTVIVVGQFSKYQAAQFIRTDTEAVIGIIEDARAKTLSSVSSSQYGVHFDTDTATLFTGSSYSSSDPDNKILELSSYVQITDVSLVGGGDEIVFERLSGNTNQYGSITLEASGGDDSRVITVTKLGIIESI